MVRQEPFCNGKTQCQVPTLLLSEKRVFVKTATGEHTVPGADTFCLSKLQWENTVPGHTWTAQYCNI